MTPALLTQAALLERLFLYSQNPAAKMLSSRNMPAMRTH